MDLLCDDVVDEILLRLPLKHLLRLRAVSRRYNALYLRPVFAIRYWSSHALHLSGVFLQSERLFRSWGSRPCFLTAPGGRRPPPAAESVLASDLGFMPQMQTGRGAASKEMIFVVHSSCGLLLCRRGMDKPVHYYVCNPVTWQCVALPELPWPPGDGWEHTGLLTLAADAYAGYPRSFKVVLVSHASHWHGGGALELKVFSSETGQWLETQCVHRPSLDLDKCYVPTFLGQSGTAYWIGRSSRRSSPIRKYIAIAYTSFHNFAYALPELPTRVTPDGCNDGGNRCLGERRDGGVRYAHFDTSAFEVWDLQAEAGACWWKLVHRADVMELAATNPEATSAVTTCSEAVTNLMNRNDLFNLLCFHPTEDVVYFDVGRNVAAYSMDRREIRIQSPRQCFIWDVFPYVHPPFFPVLIPEIYKRVPTDGNA